MKKVLTKDNSVTFHNKEFDEHYHSLTGAKEEAVKKYAEPCRIAELAKSQGEINILDVCFGLGYNSAAALDAALQSNPDCIIRIIALENDQEILDQAKNLEVSFRNYELIKAIAEKHKAEKRNISLELLFGDAQEKIKEIDSDEILFDAVFLDPFSPKKCPVLWTEEFFKDISGLMKKGAILATYSCARSVRENLKAAGLEVKDGPIVGRWAPGTLAVKK
ncbi:MAG: hypothetical protein KKE20_02260 [Nanoarchaeota archaeon]|nr:hypothetical protein [Nanoarchaeota archaeon]